MNESVDLSPVRFAELVAPAVSRTFIAGIRAAGADGRELVASYGGPAVGYLMDLRNPLAAGRRLTPADLAAVYRYRDPADIDETVRGSVEGGLLAEAPDGSLTPTDRGQEFLRELFALHGRVLTERWRPHAGPVDRLNATLARVLAAAADTGGPAWAVRAPPYEPPGTPPGVLLLNRLSTLRYHRADAHAAAWQAAGLTAAQMVAMPWGTEWTDQRHAVEQDTNRRAAAPYHGLTAEERLTLLADLATLP
ncbi:MAG: hypothetical protein ACRDT2_15605 [Natronosporangium sp.]